MSELIVVENNLVEKIFTKDGVDPVLKKIRDEVSKFVPDMTTAKGRKEIASMAYKVAQSKTYLDGLGKNLVEGIKDQAKVIDESRKLYRDQLDLLKDQVRKPLTDWEEAEANRLSSIKSDLDFIKNFSQIAFTSRSSEQLREKILELSEFKQDRVWDEFDQEARNTRIQSQNDLNERLHNLEKQEAQEAELARLKKEAAEREQADREKRIADEAARKAREEAELKAKHEAEAVHLKAKQEAERIEAEKLEAVRRENEAIARSKRLEEENKIAAERAAKEKVDAEKRAVEQERLRVQKEKEAEEVEKKRRETDIAHKKKINNEALAGFLAIGLTEEVAKSAIGAIASGKIANISIRY